MAGAVLLLAAAAMGRGRIGGCWWESSMSFFAAFLLSFESLESLESLSFSSLALRLGGLGEGVVLLVSGLTSGLCCFTDSIGLGRGLSVVKMSLWMEGRWACVRFGLMVG